MTTTRVDPGLIDALVQNAFTVTAVLSRLGAANDLSLTQLRVLQILRDRRLRMATLADHLGLDRSSLTGLVDRGEKRGLFERAPSATDGRAVEVFLAPAGLELAERLHAQALDQLSGLVDPLAPSDRRRLRAALERMLETPVR